MGMEIITIQNVRAYLDENNTVWLNLDDVVFQLGLSAQEADGIYALTKFLPDNYKKNDVLIIETIVKKHFPLFINLNVLSKLFQSLASDVVQNFEWALATELITKFDITWFDLSTKNVDFAIDILKIYDMKTKEEQKESLQLLVEALIQSGKAGKANSKPKCVYILELSNGSVKIGCTNNFSTRARDIETGSGLKIINWCHTSYIPSQAAYSLESLCHKVFEKSRIQGEFFNITFCDALNELAKHEEITDKKEPTL